MGEILRCKDCVFGKKTGVDIISRTFRISANDVSKIKRGELVLLDTRNTVSPKKVIFPITTGIQRICPGLNFWYKREVNADAPCNNKKAYVKNTSIHNP